MGVVVARGQITITALRDGERGLPGRGILRVAREYYLSTSKTEQVGGQWGTAHPSWRPNTYLWTREVYTFTDNSTTYTAPVCQSEWEVVESIGDGRNLFGFNKGIQFTHHGWQTTKRDLPDVGGVDFTFNQVAVSGICARWSRLGFGTPGMYTLSMEVKSSRAMTANKLWLNICHVQSPRLRLTTEWQKVVITSHVTLYHAENYGTDANSYGGFFEFNLDAGHGFQGGDTISMRNVMVERGAKASKYRKAEEDLRAEVEHLGYLKALFNQPTGMSDGVVFGGMMRTEQMIGDRSVVRSFLNGVSGKPALALGVENFGTGAERYVTAFDFDGNGHVGGLHFAMDGVSPRLFIPDSEGKERVTFSNRALPSIQALQGQGVVTLTLAKQTLEVNMQDANATLRSDGSVHSEAYTERSSRCVGEVVAIADNGVLKLKGVLTVHTRAVGSGKQVQSGGSPAMQYAYYTGDAWIELKRVHGGRVSTYRTLARLDGVGGDIGESTTRSLNVNVTLNGVMAGTYYLALEAVAMSTNVGSYARFVMAEPMSISYDAVDKRTHVAGNGFASFFERGQWVHIENGELQASGKTNIPGVLLSGLISTGLTTEQTMPIKGQWGARHSTSQSRRHGAGSYRVYHNVGHTDYSVQITPRVQWGKHNELPFIGIVQEVNATDFLVYLKRYDGTMVDGEFYFTIIGRNF